MSEKTAVFIVNLRCSDEYTVTELYERGVFSVKDLEKLGEELRKRGKTDALKSLADSADGQAIGRMLDPAEVERAAKSGDAAAIKNILTQVLGTDEGRRLAESLKRAME